MYNAYAWLGRQNVNGTFTDEDLLNVDDIVEIQKLLDDSTEDGSLTTEELVTK